jgi:hypothetical protein
MKAACIRVDDCGRHGKPLLNLGDGACAMGHKSIKGFL